MRLHALATIVFAAEGSLERQLRAWAAQDLAAAAIQERVDQRRIDYVEGLFRAALALSQGTRRRGRYFFIMPLSGSLPWASPARYRQRRSAPWWTSC